MSFGAAISGLRAATNDLDVTSNNIANAATNGFKQSRAEFADVYAVSNTGSGSTAIGQGVQTLRVAQQFTQGNITFTDNGLDLAISGDGFFIVEDSGSPAYTRSGAFGLDKDGFISDAKGRQIIGFQTDANNNITGASGPLQINTNDIAPQATGAGATVNGITLNVNLDSGDTVPGTAFVVNAGSPTPTPAMYNNSTSMTVYDSLGNSHLSTFYFVKTAANNWDVHAQLDSDLTQAMATGAADLTFSSSGALASGSPAAALTFPVTTGAASIVTGFDFTGTTQYGSPFGVAALQQDGFPTGRLSGLDVDGTGVVFARFTNGQARTEGQVALASFSNPQALSPVSDTTWVETFSSGPALVGSPGSNTLGVVQSGALEDSNVELSQQLVNLIIAQRNFQANAEVISTEDAVTQSIINIR